MTAAAAKGDPLDGARVLVTRASDQAESLAGRLEAMGADVYVIPTIRIEALGEPAGLSEALKSLAGFDNLLFTSVNGVKVFLGLLERQGDSAGNAPPAVCVGPRTAAAWQEAGGQVTVVPDRFTGEELVDALGKDAGGKRYLLLRPEVVKTELGPLLRQRGAEVKEVTLYRTTVNTAEGARLRELLARGGFDVITYASPSAVRGTVIMAGGAENLTGAIALCIGPTTAEAAQRSGLANVYFPEEHTVEGMLDLLPKLVPALSERR